MITLSLTEEEAILVKDSLRDIISCTIGAIHDGDPGDGPPLEGEIEVLHDGIDRLREQHNRRDQ